MRQQRQLKRTVAAAALAAAAAGVSCSTPLAAESLELSLVLVSPADRWDYILEKAEQAFEANHPDIDLQVNAQILPFGDRLTLLRAAAVGGTPLDIVSLDQPEVGDFANAGFTADLTPYIERDLDGLSDWFPAYADATRFDGGWHALWAWTDARVLWYWKDLVDKAGVDPAADMTTWDDYLDSCQKLDAALAGDAIEGCLLIGKSWIADWTLPYVWMSGGDLGQYVDTAAAEAAGAKEAWVPTFDSQAWIDALSFTKAQVDAGVEPFTEHQFGPAFTARRFATWLGGSWVYGAVASSGADMSNLGLVAAFPTPEAGGDTATMAGGWTLSIPSTSEHPEEAWEFLKIMLSEDVMGAAQVKFGYLPVRKSFAENLASDFAEVWNDGDDSRWAALDALADKSYGRPAFPSWPAVGSAITDMVQNVMFNGMAPEEAAANAQEQVLEGILGWPAGTTISLVDDDAGSCGDGGRLISAVTPVQTAADADGSGSICSVVQ